MTDHAGQAGVGCHQAGQDADERRLAGPVRPYQAVELAGLQPQVYPSEGAHLAEGALDLRGQKHGVGGSF